MRRLRCRMAATLEGRIAGAGVALAAAGLFGVSCAPPPQPGPLGPMASPASDAGLVVVPPDYDSTRTYPVVELLPPTGNTAGTLLQIYLSELGLGRLYDQPPQRQLEALWPYLLPDTAGLRSEFILVLVHGRGRADDYGSATAWARTIARYERQVLADFRGLAAKYPVDTTRLVVAGFSLGGDLAWALALRNPGVIRGAIVMASRATYRPPPDAVGALVQAGSRFFLTMGTEDEPIRRRLARAAAADLERWGLTYRFEMIPGAHHEPPPPAVFARALGFVLAP